MPKQYLTIRDWSGGTNNRKDPRDIQDNECSLIQNMSIDALGKYRQAVLYMLIAKILMGLLI